MIKPIVYGNISRYFGKKREEDGHTHQWTVYLKPYLNEVLKCIIHEFTMFVNVTTYSVSTFQDMSVYVKKVQFKLHESYANSVRGTLF